MRILLATEYFHPHWTGIAKTFHYVAKNLQSQGHDITVLTTQFDDQSPRNEVFDGIDIVRAPYQIRLSRTHYSLWIVFTFMSMLHRFDIVVINSPNSNVLFYSILTKVWGKKLVIYHQGDLKLPRMTGNFFLHKALEIVFDLLTIPSFLLADIASTYTKDYAKNSRVMKYSLFKFKPYVPTYVLEDGKPTEAFAKQMTALKKKHKKIIGFAGRFVEEKAFDVLLKAMPHVIEKEPSAHFVFAGKTDIDYEPYFDKLAPLIEQNKDNLTFLGLLRDHNYTHFFKSIDTFVISSRSDCFPTTQIEAVLQGVPSVCTDIPGARMLVKKTGYGEIAEPENPQDLADKIIKALNTDYSTKKNSVTKFFETYKDFPV